MTSIPESQEYYIEPTLPSHEQLETQGWLLTFADLLALILTFFILIYSMSSISDGKWKELNKSLQQRLNPSLIEEVTAASDEKSLPQTTRAFGQDLDFLSSVISRQVEQRYAAFATVTHTNDSVTVSLKSNMFFDDGSANLRHKDRYFMQAIINMLQAYDNKIQIHVFSLPSNSKNDTILHTPWELSFARGIAIEQQFRQAGYNYTLESFGGKAISQEHVDIIITPYKANID